jgi:tetratricopeptide (TPR) repeat protein
VRRQTGDFPGAADALEEALDICRDIDYRHGQANALTELGVMQRQSGNYRDAADSLEEALDICRPWDVQTGGSMPSLK